ncbi:MAG: cytochrome c family protein, partial [Rubripirellula sp.]
MTRTQLDPPLLVAVLFVGLFVSGCSSSDKPTSSVEVSAPELAIADGEGPSQDQIDRMMKAKEALFTRLSGRLMETMAAQGPVAAISVCQKEAPSIASEVSSEHGLQIGRTGVRLRNPENAAPAWATELTDAKADTATFVTLTNGHAAALLPIKLQGQCLM